MFSLRRNLQNTAKSIIKIRDRFSVISCDNIKRNKSTVEFGKSYCLAKHGGSSSITYRTMASVNQMAPPDFQSFNKHEEIGKFMKRFPDIIQDLKEAIRRYDNHSTDQLFTKAMEYNVPKGNFTRTLSSILTYKHFANEAQTTEDNFRLVHYLGWCSEMLLDSVLIMDDIMDESLTRRNQKCWHLLEGVGLNAINDALLMENGIYYILKKYFGHTDYYIPLMELFQETYFVTGLGQALEMEMTERHVTDFNMDIYQTIADNKSSFFSLYLPVAVVMLMLGKNDPKLLQQALDLSNVVGAYCQINNDYLDVYADPTITGKIGTDIEENKCTWLAIKCMERATPAQKRIMKDCYGQKDPEKVKKVKQLYDELDLHSAYMEYEREIYDQMIGSVRKGDDPMRDLFSWITYMYIQTRIEKLNSGK